MISQGISFAKDALMKPQELTALTHLLAGHVVLGKSRLETLGLLIAGMIGARTVNLSHLACERASEVLIASTYRRLQRFFQFVRLPEDWAARLIVALSGVQAPWYLCLDRTNWKIGKNEINVLLLAIATRRFRVPLMWTVLNRAGASTAEECEALVTRYLGLFGASSIRLLLADREFIALKWMVFLDRNAVPFAIRVKEVQFVNTQDGRRCRLRGLMLQSRGRLQMEAAFIAGDLRLDCHVSAKRINGCEALIVVSNQNAIKALDAYRKRWAIECLFGDAKTRGLNLEDTRLTMAARVDLLVAVAAIAVSWVCRTATKRMGKKAPPRKKHGYLAKSWFRIGFDELRRLLRTCPERALQTWQYCPKKARVV